MDNQKGEERSWIASKPDEVVFFVGGMEVSKDELQSYWEVANIAHFCYLFKKKLRLSFFDFEDLENGLLEPLKSDGDESGKILINKIIKTLVSGYFGINFKSEFEVSLEASLHELIQIEWVGNDKLKNPLIQVTLDENGEERAESIEFHSLHPRTKVQILNKLCDYRLSAPDSSQFVKEANGKLRQKPIGIDSLGYVYWYFHGRRLYKEKPKVAKILVEKLREPMKPVNGASSPVKSKDAPGSAQEKKDSSKTETKESRIDTNTETTKPSLNSQQNGFPKTMASGLKNQTTLLNWLKTPNTKPEVKTASGVPVAILKESWSVVCFNVEDWRKLIERMKQSLSLPDRELAERFKLTYLPKVIDAEESYNRRQRAEERARAKLKREQEMIPRRTSSRIASKISSNIDEANIVDEPRSRPGRHVLRVLYRDGCDNGEDEDVKDKSFNPTDEDSNLSQDDENPQPKPQQPPSDSRYPSRRKVNQGSNSSVTSSVEDHSRVSPSVSSSSVLSSREGSLSPRVSRYPTRAKNKSSLSPQSDYESEDEIIEDDDEDEGDEDLADSCDEAPEVPKRMKIAA